MNANEQLRMPPRDHIRLNQIPGSVLMREQEATEEIHIYHSYDGQHRLHDFVYKGKNRRDLTLQVGVNSTGDWVEVMSVSETLSPKGLKVLNQSLLITGIYPDGKSSVFYIDDDGLRKVAGVYGVNKVESVAQLLQLGAYAEADLPKRVDKSATMKNFFDVVRSGMMTQPTVVGR